MKINGLVAMVALWAGLFMAPMAAQADWVRVSGKGHVVCPKGPVVVVCDACRVRHHPPHHRHGDACRLDCCPCCNPQYQSYCRAHKRRYHRVGDHYFVGASIHTPGLTLIFGSHD